MSIIVDSFAGGGGASLGIAWALGRSPDIAINHDAEAIRMHCRNHPDTVHFTEDVWKASPRQVTKGRRVSLLWASPDCCHFSRAKGAKPVSKKIRSLAWVVVKWAVEVKPDCIMLENVREFQEWGPLIPQWECKACDWRGTEGQTILARVRRRCPHCDSLRLSLVHVLDKRSGDMVPAMVPDPTRKGLSFRRWVGRLRNLGYNVQRKSLNAADFGAPTHRRRLFLIARRDGKPIVWPEQTHCDPKKIGDMPLFDRPKPWRTAAECIDWSLPCPSIFDRKKPLAENTLRRIALGMKRYVIENPQPFIVQINHGGDHFRGQYVDQPMSTVTGSRGQGIISPTLIQMGYGERDGQSPRVPGLDVPLGTVVSGGQKHALVAAFLSRICQSGGNGKYTNGVDEPLTTVVSKGEHCLTAAHLVRFAHDDAGVPVDGPLPTVTSQGLKFGLVYAFLIKYFGTAIGADLRRPLDTATTRDRFGLITVQIAPGKFEPAVGVFIPGIGFCVIADIGLRMLTPRELARAQGFPDTYILTGPSHVQVAKIGNSVSPYVAKALAAANIFLPERQVA